ncbi:MAG: NYN domain-containing protein [Tannerellaceae bacterium]|jgi:uncharacterized LabA/DUF88 family protein|nr:NYN domain-containing protein [Tannerellaceae bacterium]
MKEIQQKTAPSSKQRVIVYVDGFNFYYGLKDKKWKKYYWLDMVSFFESLLRAHQELIGVKYFSAIPSHAGKKERQDLLFSANKQNPRFRLVLGKYLSKNIECRKCGSIIHTFEEKETDVRIAVGIIADAYNDRCDISVLVSADSDLIPSLELLREIKPKQKMIVFFPPKRFSSNLKNMADGIKTLDGAKSMFEKAVLPEEICLPSGYVLKRPEKWK